MNVSKKAFGAYIKKKREEKNISREELANKLNVSYDVIYKWESGLRFPNYEMIGMLAESLDVSVQELYDNSISDKDNNVSTIIASVIIAAVLVSGCVIGFMHGGAVRSGSNNETSISSQENMETEGESNFEETSEMTDESSGVDATEETKHESYKVSYDKTTLYDKCKEKVTPEQWEQIKKTTEDFDIRPREMLMCMGELPEDCPRLTMDNVKEAIEKVDIEFLEEHIGAGILVFGDAFSEYAGAPDHHVIHNALSDSIEFYLDDAGEEIIWLFEGAVCYDNMKTGERKMLVTWMGLDMISIPDRNYAEKKSYKVYYDPYALYWRCKEKVTPEQWEQIEKTSNKYDIHPREMLMCMGKLPEDCPRLTMDNVKEAIEKVDLEGLNKETVWRSFVFIDIFSEYAGAPDHYIINSGTEDEVEFYLDDEGKEIIQIDGLFMRYIDLNTGDEKILYK